MQPSGEDGVMGVTKYFSASAKGCHGPRFGSLGGSDPDGRPKVYTSCSFGVSLAFTVSRLLHKPIFSNLNIATDFACLTHEPFGFADKCEPFTVCLCVAFVHDA